MTDENLNWYHEGWLFMKSDSEKQIPMIFLAGSSGVGKSSLGEKACQVLGFHFLDLSIPAINNQSIVSKRRFWLK